MIVTALLGTIAAIVVAPGLPYDEPSHWANVLFVAENRSLPVLGDADVTYEGQQAPLYYVAAAVVASVFGEGGFLAVRLLGVVGHVLLTGLTAVILQSIVRERALVAIAGTAFVALNPMLIVMSASVQNDTWALVWGFAAVAFSIRRVGGQRWVQGVIVGVLSSFAILTKVSLAPLLLGIVLAYVLRRRFVEALSAVAVTAVLTSWWFVRNFLLYGDLTGQSAVARTGAIFENAATTPLALLRAVLTYLTLPTEYLRNTIAAPEWVDLSALLIGVALATGTLLVVIRERRRYVGWGLLVVGAAAIVSLAAWLLQVVFGWPVAFRTAYGALPFLALAMGTTTQLLRARWTQISIFAVVCGLQLAMGVWVTISLLGLDQPSMLL